MRVPAEACRRRAAQRCEGIWVTAGGNLSGGIEVVARYQRFDDLAGYAEAQVADWPRVDALRLVLVLEELFTNSIKHGYGGECERPIRLRVERDGPALRVCYEDHGQSFDPCDGVAETPSQAGGPPPATVGGRGLWLVRTYVREHDHEYADGVNRIRFVLEPGGRDARGRAGG